MAFKMKGSPMQRNFGIKPNNSPVNMGKDPMKMAKNSAYDMAKDPMKMVNKSPLDRALVGDQKNLPDHLKKKIEAAPTKMVDPSPMKVAPLVAVGAVGTLAANAARVGLSRLGKRAIAKYGPKIIKKTKPILNKAKNNLLDKLGPMTAPKKTIGTKIKDTLLGKNKLGKIIIAGGIARTLMGSTKSKKNEKVETTKPKVTLDTKVKGGSKTWRQGMKSSGSSLNDLAKKRDTLKKGSDEYNAVQNKINVHLGSKKRHGVTSSTGTKGRKTTTTKKVPGVSSSTSVTKKRNIGGTKTVVNKSNLMNNTSSKTKTKNNKRKVTTYNEDGTISKTKVNTRTGRVKTKTRKKGGTGLFNRKDKSQF